MENDRERQKNMATSVDSSAAMERLLAQVSAGDPKATEKLLERLYTELHSIAQRYMSHEREDHTLQPTALVNEAYIRLLGNTGMIWKDKVHFLATAARTMRRILVDHARKRLARKRGGGDMKVTLHDNLAGTAIQDHDILAVHEALERLAELSERQARVIDLRFFAGLSVDEVARVLGVSTKTVKNETRMAKAWLKREMT